jgi:hypothetical protein
LSGWVSINAHTKVICEVPPTKSTISIISDLQSTNHTMMFRTIAALSRINCHQHQPRAILRSWSSTSAAAAFNNVFALNQQIKCQPREHPSPQVACAAAAFAALIATLPSSDPRNDPAITKAEAHLDPNMHALGKSLQASHE